MKLTAVFNASGNDFGVEISGQNVSIEIGAQMEISSSDPCVGVDTKSQLDAEVRSRKLNVTIGNPILREGGGGGNEYCQSRKCSNPMELSVTYYAKA